MTLRSTTNLVVPKELQLDRKELKSAFLYVYNKGYVGPEPAFISRLWLSSVFPEIAHEPTFGKNRKGIKTWSAVMEKSMMAGYLRLNKVNDPQDPHFVASIPMANMNRHSLETPFSNYLYWFAPGTTVERNSVAKLQDEMKGNAEATEVLQRVIPGAQVIQNAVGLDARGKLELAKTLLSIRIVYKGSVAVIFADFKISKEIAQQLTTTEWLQIRSIDLYPLLLQWVAGQYGYKTSTPLAAFPVSKIARTLPPVAEGQARVNKEGLSIDHKGVPMWLPEKLDNTGRYEDLYSQVGLHADGSFGLLDVSSASEMTVIGEEVKPKLPANIPVLIDWVNNKYAFTLSTGMLKVLDLSRNKAADATHIKNLLTNTVFTIKAFNQIVALASSSGVSDKIHFTPAELTQISNDDAVVADTFSAREGIDLEDYFEKAERFFLVHHKDVVTLGDISPSNPIFAPLSRYMVQAHAAILANLDAVNTRYAVSTVSVTLGVITLLAKYAVDFPTVEMESNKLCDAALNQNVDLKWQPPSIPLLSDKIGFLPHQKKCRNLLKDSPAFAILPVQAGGGKSVLTITDILYEIKANRSQPYLILCPGHLVAQYVKEIVFFTSGKLNAVPINTYVLFRNGFDRLTKMLESAPRNTVVVVDYDCLRYRPEQVCYGTGPVTIYPVIEFLRQFGFGYAMLDESHLVKNEKSQRTKACLNLIADIPKKRLASGTMAHDSPSDLASQIAMMDPTLFGTKEQFNDRFGSKVRGDRVIEWKPGAQQAIMKIIQTRVVVAKAMRKEWAALLPQAEEKFFRVSLTVAQQAVYQSILEDSLEQMRADAKNNKTLQKFFAKSGVQIEKPQLEGDEGLSEEEDEAAEDAADENAGEDLEALLGFYLARVEQFITAPSRDRLGDKLQGEDRRSPKVNMIIERIKHHLDNKLPGKVLIFTNYTESAEEIFESLPPEIKKTTLLYVAADKIETGAAFETDDRYQVMVGVENSMNTGLNLQHVSRLIRTETVWNPGTLEQGNSRVNRPELKKADRRSKIYYDWIIADRTIDITKVSRLISKVIAVAKFENAEDPAYQNIAEVGIIQMNADSIIAMNDWDMNLIEYAEAYKDYKTVQIEDYAAYREKHGELKLEPLAIAPTPPDAHLMHRVPYTPGLELYGTGDLGLVRIDEYLRQDTRDEGGEEEDEEEKEGEGGAKQQRLQESIAKIVGQAIHTEFGDGIIKSVMVKSRKVDVVLSTGYLVRVAMSGSFIITRAITSTKDIRNQLLKTVGDLPITDPIDIPGKTFRIDNIGMRRAAKEKEAAEREAADKRKAKLNTMSVELVFNVSNGFLGITHFTNPKQPDASNALQALGFRPTPLFAMAQVKTARQLIKQFNVWEEAGFHLDESAKKANIVGAFQDLAKVLQSGKLHQGMMQYKFSTKNQLQNFFRQEVKPSTSKDAIKPYPMIEDGLAYIVMHLRGQPAALRATKVKAPGVRWTHSTDSVVFYGLNLQATGQKIKEILAAGIHISNIEELKAEFRKLKKVKIRNPEDESVHL